MAQISGASGSVSDNDVSAWRDDVPLPCLSRADALKNAPETDGIFFKVPKVIDK